MTTDVRALAERVIEAVVSVREFTGIKVTLSAEDAEALARYALDREAAGTWRDITATPAPENDPFWAYGPALVDADFNPNGIVEACFDGERFIGAVWDGQFDCWVTREVTFTHWMPLPAPPRGAETEGQP